MPTPVEILVRVLGAKAAAEQVREVAAAQQQLAGGAAATAPAASAAAEALQREAVAAKDAATALNRTAAAERELAGAEAKGTAAHTATTAAIQRETAALNTLRTSAVAASAAVAGGADRGRGLGGGGAGLRATAIYTLSDLISTSSYGFDPTRFLLQQGPQVAQAALLGSSLPMGTMAAYGAGFAVAAAPLIYALNQLGQIIKTRGDALALVTGTNRANTDTIGRMVEQRRAAGQLTDDEAARLQGELRASSDAQTVKQPSPWKEAGKAYFTEGFGVPWFAQMKAFEAYQSQVAANEETALTIQRRNMEIFRDMQAQTVASAQARAATEMAEADKVSDYRLAKLGIDLGVEQARMNKVLAAEVSTRDQRIEAIRAFYEYQERKLREMEEIQLAANRLQQDQVRAAMGRQKADLEEVARLQVQLTQLESQYNQIVLAGTAQRQAARQQETAALQSFQQPGFFETMAVGIDALNQRWTAFGENFANVVLNTMQSALDTLSLQLTNAALQTRDFGQAWANAGRQALQAIYQMVTQYVAGKLAMMAVDKIFTKSAQKNAATTTATSGVAGIAQAGAQGGWVGILIYLAVFAAAIAAMSAIASAVAGGYAEGGVVRGPGGPKSDSIMVRVSNGEGILNAAAMNRLGEANLDRLNAGGDLAGPLPGRGGGAAGGASAGPTVVRNQITMVGVYDSETAALKALESQRGQVYLMNFLTGNVHRVTGRA